MRTLKRIADALEAIAKALTVRSEQEFKTLEDSAIELLRIHGWKKKYNYGEPVFFERRGKYYSTTEALAAQAFLTKEGAK